MNLGNPPLWVLFGTLGSASVAAEPAHPMQSFVETTVSEWVKDPALRDAARLQNEDTQALTQAEIEALDLTCRAEVGAAESTPVTSVLVSPVAELLWTEIVGSSGAALDTFVFDARALPVAFSMPTSDYWQGDEAKFLLTYALGADARHFAEIDFDESIQAYVDQA